MSLQKAVSMDFVLCFPLYTATFTIKVTPEARPQAFAHTNHGDNADKRSSTWHESNHGELLEGLPRREPAE